jgi:hypothetical protein
VNSSWRQWEWNNIQKKKRCARVLFSMLAAHWSLLGSLKYLTPLTHSCPLCWPSIYHMAFSQGCCKDPVVIAMSHAHSETGAPCEALLWVPKVNKGKRRCPFSCADICDFLIFVVCPAPST